MNKSSNNCCDAKKQVVGFSEQVFIWTRNKKVDVKY